MAGIGFELNKLINKKNFLGKVSGYFYTTSSCLGSMILGFVLLFVIQYFAKSMGQDQFIVETFTSYTTNMVFLSMIMFSVFSLVLSRYISDMIYDKKQSHIRPSFWGVISIIVPMSFIIATPILLFSKISIIKIILLLVLLAEFVSTWVITLYITILKKYKKITLAFGLAIVITLVLLTGIYKFEILNMETMIGTIITGYGVVLILLTRILQKEFVEESKYTYEFIKWFSKYPLLLLSGFFSTLGTLIHFYIMWFGPSGKEVQGFMHSAPIYDLPAIIAYFSTIITSITFIAVLEPNFYRRYSKYFKLLNMSGSYQQLQNAKKEMEKTLKIELRNLILKQIVCTLFFVIIISKILSNLNIGMSQSMIECFKVLCVGYSLYAIGNVIMQMQLYFSDNKGAFWTSLIFLVVTALGTFITLYLDQVYCGLGIVLGSVCMTIFGSKRLEYYINHLEYNVLNAKEESKRSILYIIIQRFYLKIKKVFRNKLFNGIFNVGIISILIVMLCMNFYKEERVKTKTFNFEDNEVILNNPGMGLAPWASNMSTLEMKTKLVYVDLSWADWEPQEGKFDIQSFETKNHIEEYKKQGRQAVFRFYMDYPSEEKHMDIPQWLYQKIKQDGTWYNTSYGKGFSPNYNNELLISYHKKAIEALAQKYGDDDFFVYIELGSIGHWGEWHVNYEEGVKRLPNYETRKKYIDPYADNFKNSKLLMRYSVPESLDYSCGLYNDMIGDKVNTKYWLEGMEGKEIWDQTEKEKLADNLDAWREAPIGGEFASSYSNDYFLKDNLDITLLLLEQSHQSFIGPKIIIDEKNNTDYSKAMNQVLKTIGYRLLAKSVTINQVEQEKLDVSIDITNYGIAPIYKKTQLVLSVYDADGNFITKSTNTEFDATTILPKETKSAYMTIDTTKLQEKKYCLCISFEDKKTGNPIIELPMEKYKEKIYKIGEFSW